MLCSILFQINVAVQCLSTDFSSQKGVKVSQSFNVFIHGQSQYNETSQIIDEHQVSKGFIMYLYTKTIGLQMAGSPGCLVPLSFTTIVNWAVLSICMYYRSRLMYSELDIWLLCKPSVALALYTIVNFTLWFSVGNTPPQGGGGAWGEHTHNSQNFHSKQLRVFSYKPTLCPIDKITRWKWPHWLFTRTLGLQTANPPA